MALKKCTLSLITPLGTFTGITKELTEEEIKDLRLYMQILASGEYENSKLAYISKKILPMQLGDGSYIVTNNKIMEQSVLHLKIEKEI